jgi:hypothetical protein
MANLPLPLYIQSHALLRLRERLSGAYYDSLHIGLICSVLQKNIVPTSRKNTVLIAFELLGIKVGYLVAEPIDGIILVKTFLFITNSGTPEGETLNRVLGIGKLEKAFLKIDSLAVFVASDMLQDQRVRDIFENVGLGYLCEIEKKMQFKTRDKGYAQDFLRYIKPVIKTDTIGTSSSPKQEQSPEETQVNVNEFCEVRRAK